MSKKQQHDAMYGSHYSKHDKFSASDKKRKTRKCAECKNSKYLTRFNDDSNICLACESKKSKIAHTTLANRIFADDFKKQAKEWLADPKNNKYNAKENQKMKQRELTSSRRLCPACAVEAAYKISDEEIYSDGKWHYSENWHCPICYNNFEVEWLRFKQITQLREK